MCSLQSVCYICILSFYPFRSSFCHLGNDKIIGDWLFFQMLAVAAAFYAGVGFCAVIALARATEDKLRFNGCITLFTWVFSGNSFLSLS